MNIKYIVGPSFYCLLIGTLGFISYEDTKIIGISNPFKLFKNMQESL